MTPVRVRVINSSRVTHTCRLCGRSICKGEFCLEISVYEDNTIRSEYSCCETISQIKTKPLSILTERYEYQNYYRKPLRYFGAHTGSLGYLRG